MIADPGSGLGMINQRLSSAFIELWWGKMR
jgi:hypothetical protein